MLPGSNVKDDEPTTEHTTRIGLSGVTTSCTHKSAKSAIVEIALRHNSLCVLNRPKCRRPNDAWERTGRHNGTQITARRDWTSRDVIWVGRITSACRRVL